MRITERQLRQIIRETYEGFVARASQVDRCDLAAGRKIKVIWNEEDDESFMRSVIKIHWLGKSDGGEKDLAKRIQALIDDTLRLELPAMGYLSPPFTSQWGEIGLVIDGHVTLAANNMNTITSGYHNKAIFGKKSFRRRPAPATLPFTLSVEDFILDKGSFKSTGVGNNEFLVSNWKITGIVLSPAFREKLIDQSRSRFTDSDIPRVVKILRAVMESGINFIVPEDLAAVQGDVSSKIFDKESQMKLNLIRMKDDPDPKVRKSFVGGAVSSREQILDLISDDSGIVRAAVAASNKVTYDDVASLLSDPDEFVRADLASRQDITRDALERLATDPSHQVRMFVVSNQSTPRDILEKLADDESTEIPEISLIAQAMLMNL